MYNIDLCFILVTMGCISNKLTQSLKMNPNTPAVISSNNNMDKNIAY